jgi:ribosomal protein S18 acetylase RimI-like enzyme
MSQFSLISEAQASPHDVQFIQDAINEFNMVTVNDHDYSPVSIFVRNDAGKMVGGVLGDIWGGWLYISYLWVAPELRNQGYGTRLMQAAEDEARAKGCRFVMVETHSFQAPDFYQRAGFQVAGKLDDYPPGHAYFILWKAL